MKKLISLLIAIVLIMSSFTALAAPADVTDDLIDEIFKFDLGDFSGSVGSAENDPDLKIMEFLELLGIWDNAALPKESLISMTEFSVIMARTRLGAQNAFEGVYTYEPNDDTRNATYKDAYTYLIDALGYKQSMSIYKDEGQAVLIVASEIGLIPEKNEPLDAFITRGELAKMIYKALSVDLCVKEYTDYGYSYNVKDGENLLNKVHGIYNVSGFVNAVPGLSVFGSANLRDGFIQIDRDDLRTGGKDYNKYFGRMVEAYTTYDEVTKQHTIIYMDFADESEAFEVDFSQINYVNRNFLSYMNGDTEEEISVDTLKYVAENGKPLSALADMSDFREAEGKIVFTESEKNGEIDTAIVYRYEYFVVDYNDLMEKKIGLKFNQKYKGERYIQIDENARNVVYIDDMLSDYTKIAVNQAVRVMSCPVTDYTELYVTSERISGEVTGMFDNTVTIGGKEYRISNALLKHIKDTAADPNIAYDDKVKEIMLGTNGQFYVFGNVITNYQGASQYLYGYLKSVSMDRTSIEPDLTLHVYSQNGEWVDLKINKSFELDGVSGSDKETFINRVNRFYGTGDTDIVNNLIRYKANGENVIVALDTIYEGSSETQSDDDLKKEYSYTGQMNWSSWWLEEDEPYFVDGETIMILVPDKADDEDEYKIIKNTSIPTSEVNGPVVTLDLYSLNPMKHARAAVCYGSLKGTGNSTDERPYFMYIEKITQVILDEETMEEGYKISGKQFVDLMGRGQGKLADTLFYVSKEDFDDTALSVGDFITATLDSKNLAGSYSVVWPGGVVPDVDEFTTVAGGNGHNKHVVGTIKRVDVEKYYVIIETKDGRELLFAPRARGIINTTTNKVTEGTMSDYHPGDRVALRYAYATGSYMFKNVQ